MPKQYYYFIFIIIMTNTGTFEEVNWHNVRKKNLYELLRNSIVKCLTYCAQCPCYAKELNEMKCFGRIK